MEMVKKSVSGCQGLRDGMNRWRRDKFKAMKFLCMVLNDVIIYLPCHYIFSLTIRMYNTKSEL